MAALWGVIMGQCSGSLQQQVKAEEDYSAHLYDPVWLLQTIKKLLGNDFKMLVQTLWTGKENKEKLLEFFDNNDEYDMIRDENMISVIPQLHEVYEWCQRN